MAKNGSILTRTNMICKYENLLNLDNDSNLIYVYKKYNPNQLLLVKSVLDRKSFIGISNI